LHRLHRIVVLHRRLVVVGVRKLVEAWVKDWWRIGCPQSCMKILSRSRRLSEARFVALNRAGRGGDVE
jgi:hypothetical protein